MPRNLQAEDLPEAQLERLADVSASDVQLARAAWRKDAPPTLRNLLDAVADDEATEGEA